MNLLKASYHLLDHHHHEVHTLLFVTDLALPMLEVETAVCHEDFTNIVFVDCVTEHVWECEIMLRPIFNDLC